MLPSQGLFRSIPCPFFLAGLCERPHCSYRHCRSDIRIDRKFESEALDETTSNDEGKGVTSEKQQETGTKKSITVSVAAQPQQSHEPVNKQLNTIDTSFNSCIKLENKTKDNLEEVKRLKTERSNSSESNRKRSRDSEEGDSCKRRRVSTTSTGENMGDIYSKLKSVTEKITGSSSNEVQGIDYQDIDEIVRHIQGDPKPEGSSEKSKNKKSHKKHKRQHRDSDSSSSSQKEKDRRSSPSHKKENRNKHDGKSGRDERKDKDGKDSRKHEMDDDGSHKRRKDSNDSGSTTSSPKDHKRIRKSSNDLEDHSKSNNEKQSSEHRKRKESGSSSTTKREERGHSRNSNDKFDSTKEALKSVQNSIDVSNRFNALAESSADESAYNSDTFDESLEFNYCGSDLEDDPELIAQECLEMFENYKPEIETKSESQTTENEKKELDLDDGFCLVGKKRVAHANAVGKPSSSSSPVSVAVSRKPTTSKNLQTTLSKRYESQTKSSPSVHNGHSLPSTSSSVPPKPSGKLRIAHVPNADKLAHKPGGTSTFKTLPPAGNSKPGLPGSLTYSQTAAKGTKREAHKPSAIVQAKVGPIIVRDAPNKTSKIPLQTRQCIMDKMYTEYTRICRNPDEAFQMAINKENELLGKCSTKQVYYSFGISIISGLRKAAKQESEFGGSNRIISHEQILTGSLEAKNCSVRSVKKDDTLPQGNRLYKALRKYLMTEQQLVDNGYPRPHPSGETGRAQAKPRQGDETSMSLTDRICDRCRKRYKTSENGDHEVVEVCNYHWGRKYSTMSRAGRGAREKTYVCCGSDDDKIGCVTAVCHVSKSPVPISSQKGFVQAINEEGLEDRMGENEWDIIGIDCEMVYTTHGNELARVTIVRVDSTVLFDKVIKPTHRVLDCNSRFSGLTHDQIDQASWGITDVQAVLLSKIRPNTIIIGHSLENDLIALRLKHECVIDTTLLYPHRMGPPKKRALKNLSAEVLKKVIQESDSGHDSCEDAQIAVELVLAKLKSDSSK